MYKYGMTQWVAGNEKIERSFQRLSLLGYDSIEYASDPDSIDIQNCKELMKRYNIRCMSLCGLFGEDRDLTASIADAQNARNYIMKSIKLAVEFGANRVIVVPSPVRRTMISDRLSYEKLWDNAVDNLKLVAPIAADAGVTLVIEAINRYETYLVNTLEQSVMMAKQVDSPAVAIMADVFHMSIEESNISRSLYHAGDYIKHVHIADSNRAAAGMGHTDFSSVLNALYEIGYKDSLTMEFMCRTSNPYSLRTEGRLSEMMDDYAKISINYMKDLERSILYN